MEIWRKMFRFIIFPIILLVSRILKFFFFFLFFLFFFFFFFMTQDFLFFLRFFLSLSLTQKEKGASVQARMARMKEVYEAEGIFFSLSFLSLLFSSFISF